MATVSGQVHAYNRAVEILAEAEFDFDASDVEVSLHGAGYVPNASHAYGSDLSHEVVGGNYARKRLQGREVTFDEATQRFVLNATRVVWPMSSIIARWAVIRFVASTSAPVLLCWVDLGAQRQTNSASFIIGWEADRILEIEGAAA